MDVVITGASGTVGTAVLEHLSDEDRYDFTPVDVEEHPDHDTVVADVAEYDEIRAAMEGHDAVVHLALNVDLNVGVKRVEWFRALEENLRASTNVYDAALDLGFEDVVWASTNHVVGMYEEEHAPEIYYPGYDLTVDSTVPVRPDSLYGAQKAYDEALGRFCAEYHDLPVSVIRICSILDAEVDSPYGPAERAVEEGSLERGSDDYERRVARMKAMWHSRRDFAHMVDRCLQADTNGFNLFYGVSDNDRRWFDIENARETIGYSPRDNGDEWTGPRE